VRNRLLVTADPFRHERGELVSLDPEPAADDRLLGVARKRLVVVARAHRPAVFGEELLVDRAPDRLVRSGGALVIERRRAWGECAPPGHRTLPEVMPAPAFGLALAAAFLHAIWNLMLARERDPEAATAVALVAAVAVFAPVTAVVWRADARVWPFILTSSLLQLLYFALLAAAYARAELSVVYPIARG